MLQYGFSLLIIICNYANRPFWAVDTYHWHSSVSFSLQISGTLQQIGTFAILKNLRYSILITTQEGESEAMGLPFLLL